MPYSWGYQKKRVEFSSSQRSQRWVFLDGDGSCSPCGHSRVQADTASASSFVCIPASWKWGGSTEWRVWGSDGPGLPWFRITSAHVPRAGAQSWGHTGCKGAQEVRSGRQPRKIRFWWLASCLRLRTLRLNLSDMATFFEHCIMVLSQTGFIL